MERLSKFVGNPSGGGGNSWILKLLQVFRPKRSFNQLYLSQREADLKFHLANHNTELAIMGNYFKPWRRKIGVVTLVMACVFTAGWMRSFLYSDDIAFWPTEHSFFRINSFESTIHIKYATEYPAVWVSPNISKKWVFPPERSNVIAWNVTPSDRIISSGFSDIFDFGEVGIKVGSGFQKGYFALANPPYWSVVIPLTLLSSWLLLSKPRAAKTSS